MKKERYFNGKSIKMINGMSANDIFKVFWAGNVTL